MPFMPYFTERRKQIKPIPHQERRRGVTVTTRMVDRYEDPLEISISAGPSFEPAPEPETPSVDTPDQSDFSGFGGGESGGGGTSSDW